jgi:AhpD family alkylhydroperoxidase
VRFGGFFGVHRPWSNHSNPGSVIRQKQPEEQQMGHYHELSKKIGASTKELRAEIPDVYQGFAHLHRTALADGALSAKVKELMALAISIVDECDGCIASHARGAARQGATDQEAAEAIGVAILMSGGPGTIYGPRGWDAFQEFSERFALTRA